MYDFDYRPAIVILVVASMAVGCGLLLAAQWVMDNISIVIR